MINSWLPILLFTIQVIFLFFTSRIAIVELFHILSILLRKRDVVFSLLAVLFLPGTIVHEMSHFLMAILLFLPVGEIRIMPEWEKNQIQLGRVTYGKKDFIRSILVGIAPFFGALFFFWFTGAFNLFPSGNLLQNLVMGYLVFTVAFNMFSSQQDLVDIIYIIPLTVILGVLIYILNLDITKFFSPQIMGGISMLLQSVNFYITISLGINAAIIIIIRSLRFLIKR